MGWISAALLAALFAGVTSILAKCGVRETDSDIATGIRTAVVLVFAWIVVFVTGAQDGIAHIAPLSWTFLIASGLATGASWICYFKALSFGNVNKVVSVDKSSTILAALIAIVLFGETSNLVVKLASIIAIGVGTYLMIERKATQGGGDAQGGGKGGRVQGAQGIQEGGMEGSQGDRLRALLPHGLFGPLPCHPERGGSQEGRFPGIGHGQPDPRQGAKEAARPGQVGQGRRTVSHKGAP